MLMKIFTVSIKAFAIMRKETLLWILTRWCLRLLFYPNGVHAFLALFEFKSDLVVFIDFIDKARNMHKMLFLGLCVHNKTESLGMVKKGHLAFSNGIECFFWFFFLGNAEYNVFSVDRNFFWRVWRRIDQVAVLVCIGKRNAPATLFGLCFTGLFFLLLLCF